VTQALVTTKLRAPRTRPILVARPRLRDALAAGEGRSLTLVSAPAGFGKTTLLGEWKTVRRVVKDPSPGSPWTKLTTTCPTKRGTFATSPPSAWETRSGPQAICLRRARPSRRPPRSGGPQATSMGRLREAEEAFQLAMRFVTEEGVGLLPSAGVVHVGMADLHYERNDLDGAEHEMKRGMELAEQAREVSNLVGAYITLSRVKRARGGEMGALETACEAERVARTSGADLQIAIAGTWMARLRLARGDLAEAAAFEQERAANAASGASQAVDRLTSARLLHARGRHNEALRLLGELREAAGRTGDLIEILSLQTLALWASNEKEQAVGTLTQALQMAEPEGYVRTFVDEGAPMGDLLSATLEARQSGHPGSASRVPARYLAKLLAALAQETAAPASDGRLPESLSERELGVRSRTQAIARAREMDLL
jgi:ATP/maltotriose-dependent transcriptional regulator MalT